MLQYVLTALAGVALGVVGLRIWQSMRNTAAPHTDGEPVALAGAEEQPVATSSALSSRGLLIGAGALVAAAIAIFVFRSPDEAGSATISPAATGGTAAAAPVGDVDSMIDRLADRLKQNPGDGEGFRMLGWSYLMTGHPDKAIEPYKRAVQLLPRNASAHAGYGEALVAVAGGRVTNEAKAALERATAIEPGEMRSRYFLALWKVQNGQEREALDKWVVLANQAPSDATWLADLRKQITETSAKLGVDVSARLKPAAVAARIPAGSAPVVDGAAVQAAQQLPAAERQAMINGMVEGLAAKLKANPKDADGWIRLMRSRMVLGQAEQATRDLATARAAFAGDAASLQKLDEGARAVSVPAAR